MACPRWLWLYTVGPQQYMLMLLALPLVNLAFIELERVFVCRLKVDDKLMIPWLVSRASAARDSLIWLPLLLLSVASQDCWPVMCLRNVLINGHSEVVRLLERDCIFLGANKDIQFADTWFSKTFEFTKSKHGRYFDRVWSTLYGLSLQKDISTKF